MKIRYDKDEDILMVKVSDEPIDYAEEIGQIIVHFTKEGKPALYEIMDAVEFLTKTAPNQIMELEKARQKLAAKPKQNALTIKEKKGRYVSGDTGVN